MKSTVDFHFNFFLSIFLLVYNFMTCLPLIEKKLLRLVASLNDADSVFVLDIMQTNATVELSRFWFFLYHGAIVHWIMCDQC